MTIQLRPAGARDAAFLLEVYASTRADELALVPWTPEQKCAFVEMQFNAQRVGYLDSYPGAEYYVIQQEAVPVGRMIVDRSGSKLLLIDIALLPEYRNAGIGTRLVRDLQEEASQSGKPMILHVEFYNRALRLYERLGFHKAAEMGIYWEMEWTNTLLTAAL